MLCCGGGGLCAGSSLALKSLLPRTLVFGVEPDAIDDTKRSLASGKRENNVRGASSICDALLTQCGELTFSMNKKTLDGVLTVRDDQALWGMQTLFTEYKLVAEPGGAVAVSAVISSYEDTQLDFRGKTIVAIVSGGNVERETFMRALQSEIV